jgi:ATP-dependent RNA helicase CshB
MLEDRGLKTEYKEISNNQLVDGKIRGERTKRMKYVPEAQKKAIRVLPKPKDVKPGYKKKYQEKVGEIKEKFAKKRGKY